MDLWVFLLAFNLASAATEHHLAATALVEDEKGNALLECWEFDRAFDQYPTVGMALPLGNVSNMTYVALPPRSAEGIHNPPHPMFFVLLSGLAHITIPGSGDEAWIMEGVNGLLIAVDHTGMGHYTDYPSDKTTIALQIPFENGKLPEHRVLHPGACQQSSQIVTDVDEGGRFDL